MAAYIDKTQLNTPITDNTKLDLSHVHVTTAQFQQLTPIYITEMVPGQKIECEIETLSRMNPMPVPTFGRANINNRAYFVPYRTIFRGWNDFIVDENHIPSNNDSKNIGIPSVVPTVNNNSLVEAFLSVGYGIHGTAMYASVSATSDSYDFCYVDPDTHQLTYRRFTVVGQQVLKVLESLGYKINWDLEDTTPYSALNLLAFAKVYMDYYYPMAYHNTTEYNLVYLLLNADTGANLVLNSVDVGRILSFVWTCYNSDYFTSAFDNPVSPTNGNYSNFKIHDITVKSPYQSPLYDGPIATNLGDMNYNSYQTPVLAGRSSSVSGGTQPAFFNGVTNISDYALTALKSLTDYMRRNQIASNTAQRFLAQFGKALSPTEINQAVFLGTQTIPLQIGDVTSTSIVEGDKGLGAFAGKGIAYDGNGQFNYGSDEFGVFIVVSSIVPSVGYYQGVSRQSGVKRLSKMDFYQPSFDGLGVQPITADELYTTFDGGSPLASGTIHTQVFGFTPRYADYKTSSDQLTGNFRIRTLNGAVGPAEFNGADSWHLFRSFQDSDFANTGGTVSTSNIVHSVDFMMARQDYGEYNRIFQNADWDAPDQFTMIHNFNCISYFPGKSLYENYEFEDKGKKVSLQVNGVQKN